MDGPLKNPQTEILTLVEIVKHNLFFAVIRGSSCNRKLKNDGDLFYFSIDEELQYNNYYCDFGPLSISCLFKYCMKLNKYLQYGRGIKGIVHYTCSNADKKANAAFLIGAYCVIYLKMQPRDIYNLLEQAGPFKHFLDASQFICQFTLKIIDCYQAIAKAIIFNFFNFNDFNSLEYDLYNKLEYGDLNWLLPRKFLAFIGPADNGTAHSPGFYIKYFLKNDVKTVVRLNTVKYDSYAFMQVGIEHFDLIYPDGTVPPKEILMKFLYIAESAPAAIAVHCKAGLGRTGSLIGAYLIKHYRMTAREAIAWLRICRPGSVIGQQQIWLEKIQNWLWRIGTQYRLEKYGESNRIPRHKYGIYSKVWPTEREKLLRETRKKLQSSFTKSQLEALTQAQNTRKLITVEKMSDNDSKIFPTTGDSFKNISKLLSSVHGMCSSECKPISDMPVKQVLQLEKCIMSNDEELPLPLKIKQQSKKTLVKQTAQKFFKVPTLPTQGDKLNEIKAIRLKSLFRKAHKS
ncbi:unnamed protein product [Ceutorhynchus assimilis]|uniref:protein-tyrosine-phosphatase n=1 Tax=Ceutorhynchus assimilis TaxID=467358 RepID=A0A9N9QCK8_9CUCU|nr:unnamed protein product [Ceutorhynchus assimilis]